VSPDGPARATLPATGDAVLAEFEAWIEVIAERRRARHH
jgi:hypothetical protein